MMEADNEITFYTPEDTLTVSSQFSLDKKRVLGAIKLGIKRANNKGEHKKTYVSLFGDGLDSNTSRAFHIVFHRIMSKEEKETIEKTIIEIGRKASWVRKDVKDSVLVRWKVINTNGYLEKHSNKWYWERVC